MSWDNAIRVVKALRNQAKEDAEFAKKVLQTSKYVNDIDRNYSAWNYRQARYETLERVVEHLEFEKIRDEEISNK